MDIRTKLVFALVSVALGSMLVLSLTMYSRADAALRESRLDLLDALAESKQDGLEQVFEGWIDRVRLVASRTQLRLSLQEFNRSESPQTAARIQRILTDAVEAVAVIEALTVFDTEYRMVASAGREVDVAIQDPSLSINRVDEGIFFRGVSPMGEGDLRVAFVANLAIDGESVGVIHVRLNAKPLLDLAEDRSGWGEDVTGEIVILTLDETGVARALHRSHPGGPEVWDPIQLGGSEDPAALALGGQEGVFFEGVIDDRGNAVWAGVRSLPEANMGLVVKVDEEEARAPFTTFRSESTRLGLSLGAFAIIVGTILGFRFTRPIKELARVADRIREGTLSARAVETGEDEVGVLSRTFNDLAEEMEEQVTLLREFRRYFEVSRDMLCIAGPDGFFKRVNPAFTHILGWSEEELLKNSFLSFVHPDDLKKTQEEIDRLAMGLPTIYFRNRYRVPMGTYKYISWTAHPDEETGLIYATARDITDLKESRDRMEDEIAALKERLAEAKAKLDEVS